MQFKPQIPFAEKTISKLEPHSPEIIKSARTPVQLDILYRSGHYSSSVVFEVLLA